MYNERGGLVNSTVSFQKTKESYMKATILIPIITIFLLLSGCASTSSNYSVGKSFSSDNVNKIVKGKTTSAELKNLFGEPYTKSVISADEEKWTYMHTSGTSSAQSHVFTMDVKTTGTQKTLDILLKNGVVINYAFTEGPVQAYTAQ